MQLHSIRADTRAPQQGQQLGAAISWSTAASVFAKFCVRPDRAGENLRGLGAMPVLLGGEDRDAREQILHYINLQGSSPSALSFAAPGLQRILF
jgi:hypothetical protein